jgi:hypothetical protein
MHIPFLNGPEQWKSCPGVFFFVPFPRKNVDKGLTLVYRSYVAIPRRRVSPLRGAF